MTDKHSGPVVYAQMKTRETGAWGEIPIHSNIPDIHAKRRLRNMVFSAAAVFCLGVVSVSLMDEPDSAVQVMSHVTTDFEYDDTLGRLQFVSNMLPESVMVFLNDSEDHEAAQVFSPTDSAIEHAWSQSEPWIEYAGNSSIHACGNGDVMTVIKNHDDEYTVRVMHENGYESVYSGLSDVYVEQMEHVLSGEQIGLSGNVAAFELRRDGMSIMPQFSVQMEHK